MEIGVVKDGFKETEGNPQIIPSSNGMVLPSISEIVRQSLEHGSDETLKEYWESIITIILLLKKSKKRLRLKKH